MTKQKLRTKIIFMAAAWCLSILVFGCPAICSGDMQNDVDQAVTVIERFQEIPEKSIPAAVLKKARGLAILTIGKAGFIFTGRAGTGIVIARAGKGWSGPSAIGTGGVGFGFQAGAQITEFVVILNTPKAVQAFSQGGNVSLGTDLSVSAGPVGRDTALDVMPLAAVYTYSRSQGLFAGISLEGTVLATRNDANKTYYGKKVKASDILAGKAKAPAGAQKLMKLLSKY